MENKIISVETIERPKLNAVETLYTFCGGYGLVASREKQSDKYIVAVLKDGQIMKAFGGKDIIFRECDKSEVDSIVQEALEFTRQLLERQK